MSNINIIRDVSGYTTSRDYAKLWGLAQRQSVVCICDYRDGCRDIAQTIYWEAEVRVVARGICYICPLGYDEFISQCKMVNLEWIVPVENAILSQGGGKHGV